MRRLTQARVDALITGAGHFAAAGKIAAAAVSVAAARQAVGSVAARLDSSARSKAPTDKWTCLPLCTTDAPTPAPPPADDSGDARTETATPPATVTVASSGTGGFVGPSPPGVSTGQGAPTPAPPQGNGQQGGSGPPSTAAAATRAGDSGDASTETATPPATVTDASGKVFELVQVEEVYVVATTIDLMFAVEDCDRMNSTEVAAARTAIMNEVSRVHTHAHAYTNACVHTNL